ncbi:hypothetical protein TL16_g11216 [Triparma laevis f. inornata]|uniref:Uncharacterized protein n=1 Tax=Triparma laevis f. inornata TaxID=1714386 RepID=A0A9W7ES21_9STRA|nr:hypothetical protein TL16_g11216 [Triparma laevis f. inornata]
MELARGVHTRHGNIIRECAIDGCQYRTGNGGSMRKHKAAKHGIDILVTRGLKGVERDKGGRILRLCGIEGCTYKGRMDRLKCHRVSKYVLVLSSQMTQRSFLAGGVGGVTTTTTTTGVTGSVLSDFVKQRGILVNGVSNGGIGTMAPGFVVPAFMSGYMPGFGGLATTPAPVKEKKEVNVGYWAFGEEEENVARPTPPYFLLCRRR